MSISRQKLYALGEPFGDSATNYEAGRTTYGGGGGGNSQVRYDNLDRLYQEQADSARLLRDQAEKYLPGATESYVDTVGEFMDDDYVDEQAGKAGADMANANAMERAAVDRELTSMGVNPNDARFVGANRKVEMDNAARMAAGKNVARGDAKKMQLAVSQDAVGTFTGQSNSAASQLAGASSGIANLASQKNSQELQKRQMDNQNTANMVGGGMALWSMLKDGGRVCAKGVRPMERHVMGGGVGDAQEKTQRGFLSVATPTPPTQAAPAQPGGSVPFAQMAGAANKVKGTSATKGAAHTDKIARVAGWFDKGAGNEIGSHAAGMRMAQSPAQVESAAKAYEAAAAEASDPAAAKTYLDSAANIRQGAGLEGTASVPSSAPISAAVETAPAEGLAATAPGVSGEVGAAAAGTGAAEVGTAAAGAELGAAAVGAEAGAAATTATASGLGAGAAAVGTAMPWVGAALAVGSMLGWFADGGEVGDEYSRAFNDDNPAQDLRDGSEVSGPGSHTDDIVPALLSNDEHVINSEAAALVGHDELEKINQEGLRLREQGVTPNRIRAAGIKMKEVA